MQLDTFAVLRSSRVISPLERIISFDRAETNHDKVASPKQQSNEVSIYIAHICINFKVAFFCI